MLFFTFYTRLPLDPHHYLYDIVSMLNMDMFQANRWIKNMAGKQLKVCDLLMPDFLRELENAIQFGFSYLMQDVLESLDPSLAPVLGKAVIKIGNREVMKLGDKELDYDKNFKFYMTTKLQNPHYSPEVSTKVTIINFCVKEEGLEAQLLGIVVQEEEPKLETQKSELVLRVAAGKKKLTELEDEILHLLSSAEGSLLDDPTLVDVLQVSKTTSIEVTEQLEVAVGEMGNVDLGHALADANKWLRLLSFVSFFLSYLL